MAKDPLTLKNSRPLPPHLGIYKPQISSVLSVGHRLSGIGLFFVLGVFCWGFILWAFCGCDCSCFKWLDCGIVKFVLVVASYGYFYHFCTGIRHLMWDAGYGFSIRSINVTGYIAVIASFCLTGIYWLFM